jgi:protein-L-isoaspartate(D-aspartate) O-methyltransferase
MTDPARLMRFVLEMRQAGVTDARALSSLERTPRTHYAPAHLEGLALDDVGLPLAHAQTMTKPSIVGRMISALAPQADDVVLEIGAGSGFQAAAISSVASKVITLERWNDLTVAARGKFGTARLMRTFAFTADGFDGWSDDAPYERIIINAALNDFPPPLLAQLKPGGVIVAPLGDVQSQRLIRMRNGEREDLGPIRLQPLERGLGEAPPQLESGSDSP